MTEQFSHLLPASPWGVNKVLRPCLDWPDPCYIVGAEMLLNAQEVPAGVYGTNFLTLDVAGRHVAGTGWPDSEACAERDPFCRENLHRLVELEVYPGGRLFNRRDFAAVSCSRSRGDLLLIEAAGVGTLATDIFPGVHLLKELSDAFPNSETMTGFGPKSSAPIGDGRTVNTTYGPDFSIKFTAPESVTLSSIRFRVVKLTTRGTVAARLYAADGTTPIAAAGASDWIVGEGDYRLPFSGSVTAGTAYVVKITTGALNADIEVCAHVSGWESKRAASTLPNLDDWRVEILH